jgi:hypothetical protein
MDGLRNWIFDTVRRNNAQISRLVNLYENSRAKSILGLLHPRLAQDVSQFCKDIGQAGEERPAPSMPETSQRQPAKTLRDMFPPVNGKE